jgi:hypothetical protein
MKSCCTLTTCKSVQGLTSADYPPKERFCQWVLQQTANTLFVSSVLFTDETILVETASQISTANINGQRKIHVVQITPDISSTTGLRCELVLWVFDW